MGTPLTPTQAAIAMIVAGLGILVVCAFVGEICGSPGAALVVGGSETALGVGVTTTLEDGAATALDAGINGGLGELVATNIVDPAADLLAQRIGGVARVRFANGAENEFDAVSDQYIAQAKPAKFAVTKQFRKQAKLTFEYAIQSGRTPYFQFDGVPNGDVLRALARYADRYGIDPVIDTEPLS